LLLVEQESKIGLSLGWIFQMGFPNIDPCVVWMCLHRALSGCLLCAVKASVDRGRREEGEGPECNVYWNECQGWL